MWFRCMLDPAGDLPTRQIAIDELMHVTWVVETLLLGLKCGAVGPRKGKSAQSNVNVYSFQNDARTPQLSRRRVGRCKGKSGERKERGIYGKNV